MTRMLDFEDFKRKYQKVPVEEYPNNVLEAVPEPMVSVQISTYQHADFIRDCLDGVLMQETDFPVEILIGEDESDDGTREICKEYADRHPDKIRLFLHRRENNIKIHGQPTGKFQSTYTRFKCRGKYIALCEGDDYWTDPKKLQKQVEFLEVNEDYVVSYHRTKVVDSSGQLIKRERLPNIRNKISKKKLKGALHLSTPTMCHENKLRQVPKEFLHIIEGDIFLVSLLGRFGKGKFQSEIKSSVHRKHKKGLWSSKSLSEKEYSRSVSRSRMAKYWQKEGNSSLKKKFETDAEKAAEDSVFYNIDERRLAKFIARFLALGLRKLVNWNFEGLVNIGIRLGKRVLRASKKYSR